MNDKHCYWCGGEVEEVDVSIPQPSTSHYDKDRGCWVTQLYEPLIKKVIQCNACETNIDSSKWQRIHDYHEKRYNDLLKRIEKLERLEEVNSKYWWHDENKAC